MDIVHHLSIIRLEHGGVVRAMLDMCEALAEAGHRLTLITSDPADAPEDWDGRAGRPDVLTIPADGWTLAPLKPAARSAIARRLQTADVVHLHEIWNPASRQIAAICRKLAKPYVITPHGMLDDWSMAQRGPKKRLYLSMMGGRALLERAKAVHCTAAAEAQQASKWFPRGRAEVAPLVMDLEPFRDLPGPEPARKAFADALATPPLVLFLSRLHEKKGVHDLIRSAAILQQRGLAFTLAIAGTGEQAYEQQLRSQVAAAGLGEVVKFLGFASGIEKVSLYEAADVFALPTNQENWGFVSLEAMAAGTPVITTKGVDIWPELEASGGAMIISNTPESFADAIESLLADDDTRRAMATRAREWIFANLNRAEVVRSYEQLYTST